MSAASSTASSEGSWLLPRWERARVGDAMRRGVMSCPPDASLRTVARMMATHHVHSVVVPCEVPERDGTMGERVWGIVTDRALVLAGEAADEIPAGNAADRDVPVAEPHWPLAQAAKLMTDHGVSHVVVVDSERRPIGMLSTLDLAGVIAWGEL